MGVVCISMHLKEKLAWATDKQLRVINNSYITKELKNKAVLSLKQYCMQYFIFIVAGLLLVVILFLEQVV